MFVGPMLVGRIYGHRLAASRWSLLAALRREMLLQDSKQRIRDARQSPDGLLYELTEVYSASLPRLEPAQ